MSSVSRFSILEHLARDSWIVYTVIAKGSNDADPKMRKEGEQIERDLGKPFLFGHL